MRRICLFLLVACLSVGVASAQSMPSLMVTGNVMVASMDTGQFVTATNGQAIAAGQTLMVPAGATATVAYPDGSVAAFASGVHVVPAIAAPLAFNGFFASGVSGFAIPGIAITSITFAVNELNQANDDGIDQPWWWGIYSRNPYFGPYFSY